MKRTLQRGVSNTGWLVLAWGLLVVTPFSLAADNDPYAKQRQDYEIARQALIDGDNGVYQKLKPSLLDYPLYPYLDYRDFRQTLKDASVTEVKAFIKKYDDIPFTDSLESSFALQLAQQKRWKDLLAFQLLPPKNEAMLCNYYYAQSEVGDKAKAWKGATSIWLTGGSIDDVCDPLLARWQEVGKRTDGLILDRMLLVLSQGNKSRLEYLKKMLSKGKQSVGDTLLTLLDKPETVADFAKKARVTTYNQELTRQTYRRLARANPAKAVELYTRTMEGQHFSKAERQKLADYTAQRLLSTEDEKLIKWRDEVIKTSDNTRLIEQRIRRAIRTAQWDQVETWIARLPKKAQQTERWQFWQARLLDYQGKEQEAKAGYEAILGKRDFYSAVAATLLEKPIIYETEAAPKVAESKLTEQQRKMVARVNELIILDRTTAAIREWRDALPRASKEQQLMLGAVAAEHRWHYLTVQATIAGKFWPYHSLRFPRAHKWWFDFFAKEREMSALTMMALARQESALNTRARSPVGARGLMQLMPATAKETAEKLGRTYEGNDSLYDPGINIRLGSGYLKQMLSRFDENRVFSFAAYNAGPTRVKRWRAITDEELDVFAFIEAIPFDETRGYVQNILMFEIYYANLMGRETTLLTEEELTAKY